MSLNHIILAMLQFGPQSGYDLDKQIHEYVHFAWSTTQSQVYRTLYKLRDKGWVSIETIYQENSPNKKEYSLTEAGTEELKKWLATPGHKGKERDPFLAQMMWGHLISPGEQIAVVQKKLEETRENLAILEHRAASIDMPVPLPNDAFTGEFHRNLLALEHGILFYRFRIDWFEHVIDMLEKATVNDSEEN